MGSRRIGAGDPVVLVHGITESAASFEPVAQRLAASHEVITLDLRGHGESGKADTYDLAAMASDVLAVVAVAGVESPHLVAEQAALNFYLHFETVKVANAVYDDLVVRRNARDVHQHAFYL